MGKYTHRIRIAVSVTISMLSPFILVPRSAVAQEQASAVSEAFDDWVVNCRVASVESGKIKTCDMMQELKDKNSAQRIILLSFAADAKGAVKLSIFSPLGVKISDGLTVNADDVDLVKGDISSCLPSGCLSVIAMKHDILEKLVASGKVSVMMTSFSDNQRTRIDVSTRGLAAAHYRLLVLAKGG